MAAEFEANMNSIRQKIKANQRHARIMAAAIIGLIGGLWLILSYAIFSIIVAIGACRSVQSHQTTFCSNQSFGLLSGLSFGWLLMLAIIVIALISLHKINTEQVDKS